MTVKNILIIGSIIVLLEIIGGYVYLKYSHAKNIQPVVAEQQAVKPSASPIIEITRKTAEIILETQDMNIKKGDNFSVNVLLDTFSNPTTASDLTIKYDPKFLASIKTTDPFSPSKLFQKTIFNKIDTKAGIATVSAVADFDSTFSGRGILTTIAFRAIKPGKTDVTVDFTPRETRDSNIVSEYQDILESVQNLSLEIK